MTDCIFCKIVAGKLPSYKVYEDEYSFAFLEIKPSGPGHTMIIPKEHVDDFMDLDEEATGPVMNTVRKVELMLAKATGADNFTIGVNSGKIVGHHVNHFHVHVIPRFPDDGGGYIQTIVTNPPKEDLEEMKNKILKANG